MTSQPDPMFARPPRTSRIAANASGTFTSSRERHAAVAAARQGAILSLLGEAGLVGLTCPELETKMGAKHQTVSASLTSLHRDGHVAALLRLKRNGSAAYVLPEHVAGRDVRQYVSNADARKGLSAAEQEAVTRSEAALANATPDRPVIQIRPATLRLLVQAAKRADK